nr:hypothetical protein [Pseudoxanthomonas sp.]
MSTDKTWFDDKLKSSLFLDLGFRALVWLAVASLAFRHASKKANFSPLDTFIRSQESLMPVIVDVMMACFIFCVLAMLLKDLEHVAPTYWSQDTIAGRIGGVIRRLAGDLTLWILGAQITLLASLSVVTVYIHKLDAWSDGAIQFVTLFALVFVISSVVFSVISVWVRKKTSLVTSHEKFLKIFDTGWKVLGFYVGLMAFTVIAAGP